MNTIKHHYHFWNWIKGLLLFSCLGTSWGIYSQEPLPPPNVGNQIPPANTPPPFQSTPPPLNPTASPPPPGWASPGCITNQPPGDWMNNGTLNVMATGYDSEGVMKQIPLVVSYSFNGVNYNVTVLNAWNPYTESWIIGVNCPAYSTTYYLNGFSYNYYAPLALGTFYFNL